ncbi:integrase arm-type DNA-binding domain-containing protein [Novosphingobium sp. SL115]|uniref:integrase arm-type DNA-binding domain-containing protein n=1 Tax=Novosphingobium sp. SL115 TaxID=2995150 RepID=UPI0022736ADB|nr:integrase arm-type DNA-binding domain-containing protein [Novosphingobium sp. SL115]MCY1672099.1 integrase arm-type DNA-binding domain-containing protein [Novosphingobium sp. SL115]
MSVRWRWPLSADSHIWRVLDLYRHAAGQRIELGLGNALDVTQAEARERAADIRAMLIAGLDPLAERAKAKVKGLRTGENPERGRGRNGFGAYRGIGGGESLSPWPRAGKAA